MWVTSDVDLPDALIEAQQEDRLVAFVGAGVSKNPPSCLPLFAPLAKEVANDAAAAWDDEAGDNPDLFLGRLVDDGVDVHAIVKRKIDVPRSRPNALHSSIVRLFPSAERLRIVTTNYDRHLTTAAREAFGAEPKIYTAPALPLGRDFNGIVYLHGSVDQEPGELVVTDADFGRAYLTDAWAARFLQDLFRHYTVFFVGYRHNDVVMNYLARGLAPGSRPRYGFTSDSPPPWWRGVRIEPICYPGADDHAALGEAVGEWANLSRMGLLEHEQRVIALTSQPPPDDLPNRAYLQRIVTNAGTTPLFTRHARGEDWLDYAESLPVFRRLFQQVGELGPGADELGRWFADNFAAASPDRALWTVYQSGGSIHRVVADKTALALQRAPRADAEVIGRWLPLLLESASAGRALPLSMLLSDSRWPEDKDNALLLLDHLLQPRHALTPRFATADGRTTDTAVADLSGDGYLLRRSWHEFFRPHLDKLAAPAAVIAERHLRTANRMLRASGRAGQGWDPDSFGRSGIEPHPQDAPLQPFDLLIDIARDCLDALLTEDPDAAARLIASWAASSVPLLRRLAVYGCARRADVSPDDKLRWALAQELLYDLSVKHELYDLLEWALPAAGAARSELLEEIRKGPEGGQPGDGNEENRAYAVYNLLVWVTRVAPDFADAETVLQELQRQHDNFRPRDNPDLDLVVSSGSLGPSSPVTVQQLLAKTTPEDVGWMISYQGQSGPGTWTDRYGLLGAIGQAAVSSPEWALTIADQLIDRQNWDADLWPLLISSWQISAGADPQLAGSILARLSRHQRPRLVIGPAASLLETLARGDDLGPDVVGQMEELALRLWDAGANADDGQEPAAEWAWQLAGFWAQDTAARWRAGEDSWDGLPGTAKTALAEMLAASGRPAEASVSAVASYFALFLAADEAWATENILPAFNWEADPARAASAWSGHLRGNWNNRAAALLQQYYEQSFTNLGPRFRQQLAARVADICLYGSDVALASSLLAKYVRAVSEDDRRKFASIVSHVLQGQPPSFAEAQWEKWMRDYWRGRLDSLPLPLTPPEAGELAFWALTAGNYAAEAAEMTIRAPAQIPDTYRFFHRLNAGLADWETAPAARLAAHVLPGATDASTACPGISEVTRTLADRREPGTRDDLYALCSAAAEAGCAEALPLRDYVTSQVPSAPTPEDRPPSTA